MVGWQASGFGLIVAEPTTGAVVSGAGAGPGFGFGPGAGAGGATGATAFRAGTVTVGQAAPTGSDATVASPRSDVSSAVGTHNRDRVSIGLRTCTDAPSALRARATTREPGLSSATTGPPGHDRAATFSPIRMPVFAEVW